MHLSRIKRAFEAKRSVSPKCETIFWNVGHQKLPVVWPITWLLLGSYCCVFADPAQATTMNGSYFEGSCDAAAQHAAGETGVPLDVLIAITRTETGRATGDATHPWPWTVNMEGRGVWFDTKSEALAFVFDHFKTGARSFDVGCFQINYRWHGAQFASIEDMFDPLSNARYAATFLRTLYGESGDWTVAAGAFHSRTAVHADRYMVRFGSMLAELGPLEGEETPLRESSRTGHRQNRFPLLQKGQATGLASLVPLGAVESIKPVIALSADGGS